MLMSVMFAISSALNVSAKRIESNIDSTLKNSENITINTIRRIVSGSIKDTVIGLPQILKKHCDVHKNKDYQNLNYLEPEHGITKPVAGMLVEITRLQISKNYMSVNTDDVIGVRKN